MWPFRRHQASEVRSSRPYWLMRDGTGDAGATLAGSLECDVAIVGAGITGALVADALVGSGADIVILDQHEPAQGSTAASTALLQYEIDTHLVDLVKLLGAEPATRAYRACMRSFSLIEGRFAELLAACEYERRESLYLAHDGAALPTLRAEMSARRAIGINVDWLDAQQLQKQHRCRRPGALVSPLASTFDPLRFTRGVLAGCVRHGVALYSRTRVQAIEEDGGGLRLRIEGDRAVRARQVVVAAGYESLRFLSHEVADVDNTFALVTEPAADPRRALAMPQIWESARPYLYLRATPDGRIMLGGMDVPFSSAFSREALLPRQVRRLAHAYEKLFGVALPAVAHAWAGSFARTRDGLPYVGKAPGMHPGLQFALCYGGNGICFAAHAGEIIRAGIEGRPHPLDDVFGFGRLVDKAGGGLTRAQGESA
jgi:glycine/D-amino acid oxidase-like deaminating enzyme